MLRSASAEKPRPVSVTSVPAPPLRGEKAVSDTGSTTSKRDGASAGPSPATVTWISPSAAPVGISTTSRCSPRSRTTRLVSPMVASICRTSRPKWSPMRVTRVPGAPKVGFISRITGS